MDALKLFFDALSILCVPCHIRSVAQHKMIMTQTRATHSTASAYNTNSMEFICSDMLYSHQTPTDVLIKSEKCLVFISLAPRMAGLLCGKVTHTHTHTHHAHPLSRKSEWNNSTAQQSVKNVVGGAFSSLNRERGAHTYTFPCKTI